MRHEARVTDKFKQKVAEAKPEKLSEENCSASGVCSRGEKSKTGNNNNSLTKILKNNSALGSRFC